MVVLQMQVMINLYSNLIMANYQEARVKLTNTQWNKLKSEAKIKTRIILRLTKKNFEDQELPHEYF